MSSIFALEMVGIWSFIFGIKLKKEIKIKDKKRHSVKLLQDVVGNILESSYFYQDHKQYFLLKKHSLSLIENVK